MAVVQVGERVGGRVRGHGGARRVRGVLAVLGWLMLAGALNGCGQAETPAAPAPADAPVVTSKSGSAEAVADSKAPPRETLVAELRRTLAKQLKYDGHLTWRQELAEAIGRTPAEAGGTAPSAELIAVQRDIAAECQSYIAADRGDACLLAGLPKEAAAAFQRAVELCPQSQYARVRAGEAAVRLEQWTEAEAVARAVLQEDSRLAQAHSLLCGALLGQKKFAAALSAAQAAFALEPMQPALWDRWGRLLQAQGDQAGAEDRFQIGLAVDAKDAELNLDYGALLMTERKYMEATAYVKAALNANPRSVACWRLAGRLANARFEYAAAQYFLVQAPKYIPADPVVAAELGWALQNNSDPAGAVKQLTTALESEPENVEWLTWRGAALSRLGEDSKAAAEADFTAALKLAPEREASLREYGIACVRWELFNRAEALFARAEKVDATDAMMWAVRGMAHANKNRHEEARADLDRAIQLRPDFIQAIHARALLEQEVGGLPGARMILAAGLKAVPEDATLLNDVMNCLIQTGRLEEARAIRLRYALNYGVVVAYWQQWSEQFLAVHENLEAVVVAREIGMSHNCDPAAWQVEGFLAANAGAWQDGFEAFTIARGFDLKAEAPIYGLCLCLHNLHRDAETAQYRGVLDPWAKTAPEVKRLLQQIDQALQVPARDR